MFSALDKFNNIVVSGPQRAGTRFVSSAIAHDTRKTFIDEKDIANHDFRLLEYYLEKGNVIIHCPALCHMLHYITDQDSLVIVVRRPVIEIEASQRRISWADDDRKHELYKYGCSEGVISRIKYEFWNKVQKPILGERARDINFHDMENHSLWTKDENRKEFKWNQIKEE